jgi:hypothetical protein
MTISFSGIRDSFPIVPASISLSNYYRGGSVLGPYVNPKTVPVATVPPAAPAPISFSNFIGVPATGNISYNQYFPPGADQNNCGAAWTVDYINGYFGWGLYVTVCSYMDGRHISPEMNYGCSQELCFTVPNQIVYADGRNSTQGHIINRSPDSRYGDGIGFFGVIYGYWDGGSTVYVTGNTGSGGPGDSGYAYATGLTRSSWTALCGGGSNTLSVNVS